MQGWLTSIIVWLIDNLHQISMLIIKTFIWTNTCSKSKIKTLKHPFLHFVVLLLLNMNRYLYTAYSAQMSNSITYIHLESVWTVIFDEVVVITRKTIFKETQIYLVSKMPIFTTQISLIYKLTRTSRIPPGHRT